MPGHAEGGDHAEGEGQQSDHELRAAGQRRAADPDSVPGRRLCLLRLSSRGILEVLHLHLAGSEGRGGDRQAGGRLLHAALRGRRGRLHGGPQHPSGSCRGPFARRRSGDVARREVSEPGDLAVAAQCLAQDGRLPGKRRAGLAGHGEGRRLGDGPDHPGHLPLVPHPRALRGDPGLREEPGRVRSEQAGAAAGRLSPAVQCGPRARCRIAAGAHHGPHAHHLRAAGPADLDPVRGPDEERIRDSELWIFEECAHAAMYERVEEFNHRTLAFLRRHAASAVAVPG